MPSIFSRYPGYAVLPLWVARLVTTLVLLSVASSLPAEAQPAAKVYRIGVMANTDAFEIPRTNVPVTHSSGDSASSATSKARISDIECRNSEGHTERYPEMAAELVGLKVDLILVWTTPAALAAKAATSTIPILILAAHDPVGAGLAVSLARPGGNVTGLATLFPELSAKRLELLKELVPRVSHVAVLWNGANPANALALRQTDDAARHLGIVLQRS